MPTKPRAPRAPLALEVIPTDGPAFAVTPAGRRFTLDELRAAIGGGYVEALPLPGGLVALFDDEGAMAHKAQPFNRIASARAGRPLVGIVAFGPRAVLGGGGR